MHYLPLAQAAQLGDQLLQGLETAKTTDPAVLLMMAFMGIVFLAVVFMLTRWRSEGANVQVNSTLLKVIEDQREERKEQERRWDEAAELHRKTILEITTAHQQETEKQTAALTMQVDVLTGMSASDELIEKGIEEITKNVIGINPTTKTIADTAHAETRRIIIDSLTTAIEALAKDLSSQVDTLRESIRAANENTYQVFSEDGSLTQILVSLQSILSILKTQEKSINATSITKLIANAPATDRSGNGSGSGSDTGKPDGTTGNGGSDTGKPN